MLWRHGGNITCIDGKLRVIEQKALKAVLRVKSGTSNDLVYNELKRPDIISRIKDSQRNFFQRLVKLDDNDAIVKSFVCQNTPIIDYHLSLPSDYKLNNVKNRERKIAESGSSMLRYYASLIDIQNLQFIRISSMTEKGQLLHDGVFQTINF